MPNYPKNPVSNFPIGQKIPASWKNRRTPFDDNHVSQTGFGLEDHTGSTEANGDQEITDDKALDDNPDGASESHSTPDAVAPVQIDK